MLRYHCLKFQRLSSFGWQYILIYIKLGDPRTKKLIVFGILIIILRFRGSLCIMLRYHREIFQKLASFGWQNILIYIKVGNPRAKKLIVLGILTQSKKGRVHFLVL